jgi:hypothetical protein
MRIIVGLVLSVIVACDVCDTARELHQDRCADGIVESCVWLDEHVLDSGACVGL